MQHPGSLSTLGKIWEGVKHVGGKALKWAALGGAAALGIALLATVITPVGWVAGGIAALTGLALPMASSLAIAGASVGALFGALKGVAGVQDGIKEAEAESITNYDRGEARVLKMNAIQQRQAEQQLALMQKARGMGMAPGITPGMESPGMER